MLVSPIDFEKGKERIAKSVKDSIVNQLIIEKGGVWAQIVGIISLDYSLDIFFV